jgi:hypothetical protein
VNLTLTSSIIAIAVLVLTAAAAFFSIDGFGANVGSKNTKALEEAIRKAAVQCYAIEGSYPPDLDYLASHYGIVLNDEVYFYHYQVSGSNIMPDIAVIKK